MTKRILVADDDEGVLALITTILRDRYETLLARDGEEALRIARQEKPDLLFLDIRMPKRDGYEVCRALKEAADTAHIKIIMLTALAQESDREKAVEAGADDYFTKPFGVTALLEKVDEVLTLP